MQMLDTPPPADDGGDQALAGPGTMPEAGAGAAPAGVEGAREVIGVSDAVDAAGVVGAAGTADTAEGLAGDPDTAEPQDCAAESDVIGLVAVGDTLIGLSVAHVREAVPRPDRLSALPMSVPGLLGAMILREQTIPVVDMRRILDLPPRTDAGGIVIVLRNRGKLIGLLADSLRGMASIPHADRRPIRSIRADQSGRRRTTFVQDGTVVTLIEADEIFGDPELPFVDEADRAGGQRAGGRTKAYLLCGYNGHDMAIEATEVEATQPLSALLDSPVATGMCDGVVRHHDREVPILDTLKAFGLGGNFCRPEQTAGVLIRFPDRGLLGFELDRFHDIVRLSEAQMIDRPAVVATRSELFRGAYIRDDGRRFLVVDLDRLKAEAQFQEFATATLRPVEAPEAEAEAEVLSRDLYLIFRAAKRLACPIDDAFEIIRIPEEIMYADARHDGYVGSITHRRMVVPIFCMARILGEYVFYDESDSGILLVRRGGQMFGFMVEKFHEVSRGRLLPDQAEEEFGVIQRQKERDLISVVDLPTFIAGVEGDGSGGGALG